MHTGNAFDKHLVTCLIFLAMVSLPEAKYTRYFILLLSGGWQPNVILRDGVGVLDKQVSTRLVPLCISEHSIQVDVQGRESFLPLIRKGAHWSSKGCFSELAVHVPATM